MTTINDHKNNHNLKPYMTMKRDQMVENGSLKNKLRKLFKSHKNIRTTIDFIKHKGYIKAYGERLDS